jgi:predicted O-methyltransferase YrrM
MIIDSNIEKYIQKHSDKEDELLQELSRETHLKMLHPRMLSGALQGEILKTFSYMMRPERVLELGTFTGYSAICLAQGIPEKGKLITIELDDELIYLAEKYFKLAGLENKIEIKIGAALELLDNINETFDLVFIDADKKEYWAYYEKILPKVRKGGIIIVDNVLWNGKVVQKEIKSNDYFTKGILEFNDKITADKRISKYILPIRDGMMIIRKL